jgi:hypothetical protein
VLEFINMFLVLVDLPDEPVMLPYKYRIVLVYFFLASRFLFVGQNIHRSG